MAEGTWHKDIGSPEALADAKGVTDIEQRLAAGYMTVGGYGAFADAVQDVATLTTKLAAAEAERDEMGREAQRMCDDMLDAEAALAESRGALEEIVALDSDDHEPGFAASPDYFAGIGVAADIAREALEPPHD